MVLTKLDLKEIGKIIKEELDPIKSDMNDVKSSMNDFRADLSESRADLTDVKKRVRKIENNVESMLGFLDHQDVELGKRVGRIEKYLKLPQNS